MQEPFWRIRRLSRNVYEPDEDLEVGPFPSHESAFEERERLVKTTEFKDTKLRVVRYPPLLPGQTNMEGI
jgi:hypothetical protein